MKSGPFIKLVAESYRIPEPTVRVFMRWLREAGLITQGSSGRGAPDMTATDAARVTIALLATDRPANAVEVLHKFGRLTFNWTQGVPDEIQSVWNVQEYAPDLEQVLVDFFEGQSRTLMLRSLEILCEEVQAICNFPNANAVFDGTVDEVEEVVRSGAHQGRKSRFIFNAADLHAVQIGIRQ